MQLSSLKVDQIIKKTSTFKIFKNVLKVIIIAIIIVIIIEYLFISNSRTSVGFKNRKTLNNSIPLHLKKLHDSDLEVEIDLGKNIPNVSKLRQSEHEYHSNDIPNDHKNQHIPVNDHILTDSSFLATTIFLVRNNFVDRDDSVIPNQVGDKGVTETSPSTSKFIENVSSKYLDSFQEINDVENEDRELAGYLFKKNFDSVSKFASDHLIFDEKKSLLRLKQLCRKHWPYGVTHILGEINSNTKYAIYSSTTDTKSASNYFFYLPLTILSWKRVGFGSIIIFVGSQKGWCVNQLLVFIVEQCINLGAVLIFVNNEFQDSIRLSQVLRIFTGNIIISHFPNANDVYLMTSDSDMWPLNEEIYMMPANKTILSINSNCCSPFRHRGQTYKMFPLANVAMDIKTWCQLTEHLNLNLHSTVDDLLQYLANEFGSAAVRPVVKGDNKGWFMDQLLVSILISRWQKMYPNTVQYVPRNIGRDRIDRNNWVVVDFEYKNDAHLPTEGYKSENWFRLLPLLELMYGVDSYSYKYSLKYFHTFIDIMKRY
ncbi:hypothetical protein HELRODRAFT_172894 [Helobdella robusta]|uniref:Uncharacterized protein n=1 Tax=Helobdella robusta TaxID=6412 RepID=T1F632_HELRO|nr:hypothetical protein HELRODRAFT_172894 [Helobdella robusta]ESO03870.1 hypothetical protein HELRODRAFT_172894 [Helobdella robusta]